MKNTSYCYSSVSLIYYFFNSDIWVKLLVSNLKKTKSNIPQVDLKQYE